MLLIIDNYDSFTLNLVDYFEQLGLECLVKRNIVEVDELKTIPFEAIVLSPGPGTPESSGNLLSIIEEFSPKYPMLGICLGQQALGHYFGGKVTKAKNPMHGKVSTIHLSDDPIFAGIPKSLKVVRYHSLILSDLGNQILPISFDNSKEIMAIRHKFLPIYGFQFHPESILTEQGLTLLENWSRLNKLIN